MGRKLAALVFSAALIAPPVASGAVTLEPIGSFSNPVFVTSEPNDPDRILVVEKEGRIMVSEDGVASAYLDIRDRVVDDGERGLLSVAPSPDYASTGLLYVYYTRSDPDPLRNGDLQIDEYRAVSGTVSPATRRPVLTIDHSNDRSNHNGGQLQFGPDGFLYLATGDGGLDPDLAQDTDSLLGKVLRIWPRPAPGVEYTIPGSNPYVGVQGSDEIWSLGLRNPWRFSFDRLTGDLVIGDVGQRSTEEIDYEPAPDGGRNDNFGWPRCEGFTVLGSSSPCDLPGATPPVYTYPHSGGACSITGGYVVRDSSLGDLYGRYLFADLCTGVISSARLELPVVSDVRDEPLAVFQPSSFGEDACGRVYVASLGGDTVYRFVGDTPADCAPAGPAPPAPGPGDQPRRRCGGKLVTRAAAEGGGRVVGTAGKDVIAGSDTDDRIVGLGGGDVICAGRGDDFVKGGGGADRLRGGPGDDQLRGNVGDDHCRGGKGRDTLRSC